MKPISLALLLAAFIISCDNTNTDKQAVTPDSTENTAAESPLASALADLRQTLESGDHANIANLIDFPLTDTEMNVAIDDSLFQHDYLAAGGKLTKPLFLKHFDKIAKFTYLDEITRVFKHVPLDSLVNTNEVRKEYREKDNPCMKYYSILAEDNNVTLGFGTNTNSDLDVKDEDAAGCEYAVFWTFKLAGGKLKFVRQAAAG